MNVYCQRSLYQSFSFLVVIAVTLAGLDFDVLVPGHGDRLDPGLLEHTVDLLVEFQE